MALLQFLFIVAVPLVVVAGALVTLFLVPAQPGEGIRSQTSRGDVRGERAAEPLDLGGGPTREHGPGGDRLVCDR